MRRLETSFERRVESSTGPMSWRIILIAQRNALFEGFGRLIDNHLASAQVDIIEDMAEIDGMNSPVDLVLIHEPDGIESWRDLAYLHRMLPDAAIAVLVEKPEAGQNLGVYGDAPQLQGCLPLNLRLQVLMAAISLLLSGGQFFPRPQGNRHPSNLSLGREQPGRSDAFVAKPVIPALEEVNVNQLTELTTRERQILSLVAQGLQNKLIADRMSLSEHTVKVHVHNLMSKLNVTNRTQAAAAFHGLPHRAGTQSLAISGR